MIVVLDTNCLVAGLLSSTGPSAEILNRWRDGQFDVAVSPALLDGLTRTLHYPRIFTRYNLTGPAISAAVTELHQEGIPFDDPKGIPRAVPNDEKDDYIVALCTSSASGYLVTRDKHFATVDESLCHAVIVSPEEFVQRLRDSESREG